MPSSDDRFARQNRYGPPSGFPLTSTWPGIVHHLSGLNVYALDAPHEARSMRSSGVAPVKDHPSSDKSDFAFTAPLGFERPMACAHVKLLGPCFKTGRRGRRPKSDRYAARISEDARYTRPLKYPSPPKPGTGGSREQAPENFTPALGPARTVRRVRRQWIAAANPPNKGRASLRIAQTQADRPSA